MIEIGPTVKRSEINTVNSTGITSAISEVFLMDCMLLMRNFPDNYFDIAIGDPPYGINAPNMVMGSNPNRKDMSGGISAALKLKKGRLNSGSGKLKNRILNTSHISWDSAPPTEDYFKELFRVSKNQIIWGGNYFDLPPTRCIIAWDKLQPWENFSQWEMAWTSYDKPAKMYRISNTGGGNHEEKIHPTQKPVKLYDKIYADFVIKDMKILDTHLGSGSHRITASKHGVDFIGCEIDDQYFYKQEKRWQDFVGQIRMF